MQEFNKNTLEGSFIKNVLASIPIPTTVNTVRKGDWLIAGYQYIFQKDLIKCTYSGTLGVSAKYEILAPYDFGTYYPQYTERFKSKSAYYDSSTHEWLGNYLRCYRDLFDVDLMTLYNCYSGQTIESYSFGINNLIYKTPKNYKVVKVPIKYNKTYTIAVECSTPIRITAAFLKSNQLIEVPLTGSSAENISERLWNNGAFLNLPKSYFRQPFTYKVYNYDYYMQAFEKFLYMLIQLPADHSTSIVILEGNYTSHQTQTIINAEALNQVSNTSLDYICCATPSLLQMSGNMQYPYSKNLIQYLLRHTITSAERIEDNIKRVQSSMNYKTEKPYYGIWTPDLRYKLYRTTYKNKNSTKLDLLGYVDTQAEKLLAEESNE